MLLQDVQRYAKMCYVVVCIEILNVAIRSATAAAESANDYAIRVRFEPIAKTAMA